jgi:hypothetical protein
VGDELEQVCAVDGRIVEVVSGAIAMGVQAAVVAGDGRAVIAQPGGALLARGDAGMAGDAVEVVGEEVGAGGRGAVEGGLEGSRKSIRGGPICTKVS